MNNQNLIQLIRESIQSYISEIDHAGENAACEAKINAIGEAITTREKKMNMEGIDEAYHDMIDKSKMKELASEIKTLKKSLAKYQKQLEKLKSKGGKSEKVEDTEKKEIVDEVEDPGNTNLNVTDDIENMNADGDYQAAYDTMEEDINIYEVLHMQKLAGIITEEQYNEATQNPTPKKSNSSTVGGVAVSEKDLNVDAIMAMIKTKASNIKNIDTVPELVKLFDALLTYVEEITNNEASKAEMITSLDALIRKHKTKTFDF